MNFGHFGWLVVVNGVINNRLMKIWFFMHLKFGHVGQLVFVSEFSILNYYYYYYCTIFLGLYVNC